MLGQLRLVFTVEVAPSVIESPNATMAAASAGAKTSTPESQHQYSAVVAPSMVACPVRSRPGAEM